MNKEKFFDRDLSWLSFNERVLAEAGSETVPLYERIKFLAIFSSNLDEFFRVRVALIKRLLIANKEKLNSKTGLKSPKSLLSQIHQVVSKQQKRFGEIFKQSILPQLEANNIILYYSKPYNPVHLEAVEEIFYSKILSFIQPIILPKDNPGSLFLENRHLYIASELERDGVQYLGVVNIPSYNIARFQRLPSIEGCFYYTFIDDIIKQYSSVIFSGFTVKNNYTIKLNRDAELFLEDEYSEDVTQVIKKKLHNRKVGIPSRFLYDAETPESALTVLRKSLKLHREDLFPGGHYHNMFDLFSLPNPIGSQLENSSLPALSHRDLKDRNSIFASIDKKDVLLAFPYHKYDYILRFFNEAAIDPEVTEIKATLYRIAKESHIANALISAARNGKAVSVLVEVKARFDEENNLKWAEKMQEAGVVVKFSGQKVKVHSKIALVTKRAGDRKTKYAFLGTGNFNESSAEVYSDYALLTCHKELIEELDETFAFILGNKDKIKLKRLLVSQVNMPKRFAKFIDKEIKAAKSGLKGEIILKLNNLQDKKMIKHLYRAADQGVHVKLIVRSICCLIPRKNITIIRIVDRFLEHARVYLFHNRGKEKIYIGSADWMERNLYGRIEVVFPVYNPDAQVLIKHNLKLQLEDNTKGVTVTDQLENTKNNTENKTVHAQQDFYTYLKAEV